MKDSEETRLSGLSVLVCTWRTLRGDFFCGQFGRLRGKNVMWPDTPDKVSARTVSRAIPEVFFFHFQNRFFFFDSTSSTARSWNEAWILMMEHCAWILWWFWFEFCTNRTVNCISASIVTVPLSGKHKLLGRLPQRTTHILSLLWWWHIKSLGNGTLISSHCQWLLFNDYNGIWGEYLHCSRASATSWKQRVLLTRYLVELIRSIKQSIPFEINLWCSVSYGLSTYSNT